MSSFTSALRSLAPLYLALLACGTMGCPGNGIKNLKDDCPHQHCKTNDQCGTADTFCDPNKSNGATRTDPENPYCCVPAARDCGEGIDAGFGPDEQKNPCCPGQTCSDLAGQCADSIVGCTADEECNVAIGQYCQTDLTVYPKATGCTFHKCDTNTDCQAFGGNLSCFNNYCVAVPPCGGKCAEGSVCTPVNNTCYVLGENASASCQLSCGTGSLLVFADGKNVFDYCDHSKTKDCQCLTFPNITTGDAARYSSAALAGGQIVVSAYDGDHGDLIIRKFDKATRVEAADSPEWVDGMPASGNIVGNPAGPRGGIADPGPDVGKYTSIAYDNDSIHVAYYAIQDGTTALGNLKYARKTGSSAWVTMTVDGADGSTDTGDVGMYASITIAPDHSPVIAYFQKSGVGTNIGQTALKVARAKSGSPGASTDWKISTVQTGTRTPPPCGGQMCPNNQVCAASSGNPNGTCLAKASGCSPACGSGDSCVTGSGGSTCVTPLTAAAQLGLAEGNGLMPSIAYLDSLPVVVWYDRNGKVLKGVIATSDSANAGAVFDPTKIQALDDGTTPGATTEAHDVGRFPSLAIGPGSVTQRIAVSYMDSTAKQLRLLTAKSDWSNITPLDKRVIDNGVSTGNDTSLFVGANTSLRFVGDSLAVVYQDSTGNSLRVARPTGANGAFQSTTVASSATVGSGFYSTLVVDGSTLYSTHMTLRARDKDHAENKLQVIALP